MIYLLDSKKLAFPDPRGGDANGLFAVGGDLSVDRLLLAYSYGIFPWYAYRAEDATWVDDDGEPMIEWWCPMQRFVIFPDEIHISHSMKQLIKSGKYTVTMNKNFEGVIDNCGKLREDEAGAWLGPKIKEAYTVLHRLGFAASVEVWNKSGELAGGLYGVTIGSCFFGESMFSIEPNTSKLALISLAQLMKQNGGQMIDCQLETSHLKSMGGRFIAYEQYLEIIGTENNK